MTTTGRRRRTILAAAGLAIALGAAPAIAEAAQVSIVHGIPGFKADVYINGKRELTGFEAGAMTPSVKLPSGRYHIQIRPAGSAPTSKPAIDSSIALAGNANVSIVAYLATPTTPTLRVYSNKVPKAPAGFTDVVVRHVADTQKVDLLVDGKRVFTNLTHMTSASKLVPAGTHTIEFVAAGTTRQVYEPEKVSLKAGNVYIVYTIGSEKQDNLDELVQTFSVRQLSPAGIPAGDSGLAATNRVSLPAAPGGLPNALLLLLGAGGLAALLGSGVTLARARR